MSNWSDTNSDGQNDTWTDPVSNVATTLDAMDQINSDSDSDGASNAEEAAEDSNPYAIDTDLDGITDGDELTIGRQVIPGLSLTEWDSDGDFISDYDELHGFYSVVYTGGNLPPIGGATYSDYDGDGLKNPVDPLPEDPTNLSSYNGYNWISDALVDYDGDGVVNFFDTHPWDDTNGSGAWIDDTDGDGFDDWIDPFPYDYSNYSEINQVNWYSDLFGDSDSDGTLNWEDDTPYGPVPPPDPDNDSDGLLLSEEIQYGTSDSDWDTDQDGLSDYEEVYIYYTNPMNRFYLSQLFGWGALYTDFVLVAMEDMDNDNLPNGVEWHYGLSDADPADAAGDLDGDGVTNLDQYISGRALNANLVNYDADGDGMSDLFESYHGLSTSNPNDATEDPDGDGVTNYEEFKIRTSPNDLDSFDLVAFLGHGDIAMLIAFVVYEEGNVPVSVDEDSNGVVDWVEAGLLNVNRKFVRIAVGDLDGDGMPDSWEHRYGSWKYPVNGLDLRVDDSQLDADGDGLINLLEYTLGTHPLILDTDGDGVADGVEDYDGDALSNSAEVLLGFNPALADSDGDGLDDTASIPPNDPDQDGLLTSSEIAQGKNQSWKDHPGVNLSAAGFSTP